MARISFVVPFYKVPYEYMHQCIKSILEQSFSDIEIILVDDGSPDDCGKICDEYKEIDNRVVVIHKKNGRSVRCAECGDCSGNCSVDNVCGR